MELEAAPLLGEHVAAVLSDWLGLPAEKTVELGRDGAIERSGRVAR